MMNQGDIFKKIGQILNELQDQYEFLAHNPEQLNELELELFLANANFLSDHVQIVRKLNNNKSVKELPQPAEVVSTNVVEPLPVTSSAAQPVDETVEVKKIEEEKYMPPTFEFILNDSSATAKEAEEKPVDHTFDEALSEEEKPVIDEKPEVQVPLPPPEPVVFNAPPVISRVEEQEASKIIENDKPEPTKQETANQQRPTLNDLLAGKNNDSLNAAESSKPLITDLKKAITLNEKLLFIKDLFNGYNLAYSEAIELINKMPDFKTADAFLKNNYAEKNNWQAKQPTVDKFYALLNQRFG